MRILADSHVLLWWLDDPERLEPAARAAITNPANKVFYSAASIWEIAIKTGKGKLQVDGDLVAHLEADGFTGLPVSVAHAAHTATLPARHGDPFDRMLISQALVEGLVVATRDRLIARYDVPVLEA